MIHVRQIKNDLFHFLSSNRISSSSPPLRETNWDRKKTFDLVASFVAAALFLETIQRSFSRQSQLTIFVGLSVLTVVNIFFFLYYFMFGRCLYCPFNLVDVNLHQIIPQSMNCPLEMNDPYCLPSLFGRLCSFWPSKNLHTTQQYHVCLVNVQKSAISFSIFETIWMLKIFSNLHS